MNTIATKAPLIGITTYARNEENKFELPAAYIDAVRRAGGIPVLAPHGEARWKDLIAHIHGLVFTGGGDIDPQHYGGRVGHEQIYMVDRERDTSELALARVVIERNIPVLGICRGAQVLNVALGGTLFEHLPEAIGEAVAHRAPPREPTHHSVTLHPESRLASITQGLEFTCVSWHHQGLRDLALGLEAVARAPDNTVEAIEMLRHRWLIGVQWHPELNAAEDPKQQRLFDALVETAAGLIRA
ncbi:MAG: gamma-glutamyl-gamma-aminobutyrate hydrolase family protein [Acidiferrobacterales bacterium]